ncbi:ATG18A, partial [Symbiodinium sp. CCMP2456]
AACTGQEDCEVDTSGDPAAMLQISAYEAINSSSHLSRADCTAQFQAGLCTDGQCVDCDASFIVPNPAAGTLPNGEMYCKGNNDRDPLTGNDVVPAPTQAGVCTGTAELWTFRDPGDVMTCRNYQACYNSVDIEGMGAVCCENVDDDGQTCYGTADFELAGQDRREAADTVCSGDVCCMGYQTCNQGEARNVSSISCKGYETCVQWVTYLSGDVVCDADAPTEFPGDNHGGTCSNSNTEFRFSEGDGTHCVQCLGQSSCDSANWFFPADANVYFFCRDGQGGDACEAMRVDLEAGACIEFNLTNGSGEGEIFVRRRGTGANRALCFFTATGQESATDWTGNGCTERDDEDNNCNSR